jgi:hypothetical protein
MISAATPSIWFFPFPNPDAKSRDDQSGSLAEALNRTASIMVSDHTRY